MDQGGDKDDQLHCVDPAKTCHMWKGPIGFQALTHLEGHMIKRWQYTSLLLVGERELDNKSTHVTCKQRMPNIKAHLYARMPMSNISQSEERMSTMNTHTHTMRHTLYLFDIVACLCTRFNKQNIHLFRSLLSLLCGYLSAMSHE